MANLLITLVNAILSSLSELVYYFGTYIFAFGVISFIVACIIRNPKIICTTKILMAVIIFGTTVNVITYVNYALILIIIIASVIYVIVDNIDAVTPKKVKEVSQKPQLTLVKR